MKRVDIFQEEEELKRWERKTLGSILIGIITTEGWKRRSSEEVYPHYEETILKIYVKTQRLIWLGPIQRITNNRISKNNRMIKRSTGCVIVREGEE